MAEGRLRRMIDTVGEGTVQDPMVAVEDLDKIDMAVLHSNSNLRVARDMELEATVDSGPAPAPHSKFEYEFMGL